MSGFEVDVDVPRHVHTSSLSQSVLGFWEVKVVMVKADIKTLKTEFINLATRGCRNSDRM